MIRRALSIATKFILSQYLLNVPILLLSQLFPAMSLESLHRLVID